MNNSEDHLLNFQQTADKASLIQFILTSGRDIQRYEPAIKGLNPIIEALNFGEYPNYSIIDKSKLKEWMPEVKNIVQWMADSGKENMKAAALELMNLL